MTRYEQPTQLGLPWWAVTGLAALALPRILLHDLDVPLAGFILTVLAVVPLVVWIAAVVRAKVPSPVLTMVTIGGVYGVAYAVIENLRWDRLFPAGAGLGGLVGDGATVGSELALRIHVTASSIFTGLVVGLVTGLVAVIVSRVVHGRMTR